ncbi:MAG: site-2 protease family protein [Candidatus Bathyarchaeia archaeon]
MGNEHNILFTLASLLALWGLFILASYVLKLQRLGLEVHPLYALYKSTRLNSFLERLGRLNPKFWRVIGNMSVTVALGEAALVTVLLTRNLFNLFYSPEEALSVTPLIPGVTIRLFSLPGFLLSAGLAILLHEVAHGIQCVIEGIPIKSSAILLAVVTFGGAVEPDERSIEEADTISKLRVFASGSFINLVTGLTFLLLSIPLRGILPDSVYAFIDPTRLTFTSLSINLALINMLPIYPLDGGQMLNAFLHPMQRVGSWVQKIAMYGFLTLLLSNIALSLMRFGLISI